MIAFEQSHGTSQAKLAADRVRKLASTCRIRPDALGRRAT